MTGAGHWDTVYGAREDAALTWYEAEPALSLELIAAHAPPGASVIDVGGGQSRLVDRLLEAGHAVTVLDLSAAALAAVQRRLGDRAAEVGWIAGDVTAWIPDRSFGIWHDRAVFHFLTDAADRAGYVRAMDAALAPDGVAIIATFAPDGPEMCSGLPVVRYGPEKLTATLDALAPGTFRLIDSRAHVHVTPRGARQSFQASVFRRR